MQRDDSIEQPHKERKKEKSLIVESIVPPEISISANNCFMRVSVLAAFIHVAATMCAEHNSSNEGKRIYITEIIKRYMQGACV